MDLRISNRNPEYKNAVEWLHQFANVKQKTRRTAAGESIIRRVAHDFGRFPCIIIAGTKGKGSTASMIEAILREAGARTGLFTSPHLHSFRERIQVDRSPISITDFVELVRLLQTDFDALLSAEERPFTFELTTALSLIYFAQREIDIAIYEVGCGGHSDPVSLISPRICAITSISLDHIDLFGNTLAQLAKEKAGIIQHHIPVVSSPQHPEVHAVIRARAIQCEAPLYFADMEGIRGADFGLLPYPVRIDPSTVSLAGGFQLENARLAVTVTSLLESRPVIVPAEATARALATVSWPGRVEVMELAPTVIVDGAHNGDSAQKLSMTLRELWVFERLILVLGVSRNKDIQGIIEAIVLDSDVVIATQGLNAGALDGTKLVEFIRLHTMTNVLPSLSVPDAIRAALAMAHTADLICITGSLFVVAEAREFFGKAQRD